MKTQKQTPTQMNEQTLTRIRELEGLVEFAPQAKIVERTTKSEPCCFAVKVSYMTDLLFHCTYKKRCDNQVSYGYSTNYCKIELNRGEEK